MNKPKYSKILVVDIETTERTPQTGNIAEIGIVELNMYSGKIRRMFDQIVKENDMSKVKENAWIFQNSTLTIEQVRKAPLLTVFIPELNMLFSKYPAVAYNCNFDFNFLKSRGIKIPNILDDPMDVATDILQIPNPNEYYRRNGSPYKWPKVQECWDHYIKDGKIEPHRAVEDAEMEARIIFEMYKKGDYEL